MSKKQQSSRNRRNKFSWKGAAFIVGGIVLVLALGLAVRYFGSPRVDVVPTMSREEALALIEQYMPQYPGYAELTEEATLNSEWTNLLGRNVYVTPAALDWIENNTKSEILRSLTVVGASAVQHNQVPQEVLNLTVPHVVMIYHEPNESNRTDVVGVASYEHTHHLYDTETELGRVTLINTARIGVDTQGIYTRQGFETFTMSKALIQGICLGSHQYLVVFGEGQSSLDYSCNMAVEMVLTGSITERANFEDMFALVRRSILNSNIPFAATTEAPYSNFEPFFNAGQQLYKLPILRNT